MKTMNIQTISLLCLMEKVEQLIMKKNVEMVCTTMMICITFLVGLK